MVKLVFTTTVGGRQMYKTVSTLVVHNSIVRKLPIKYNIYSSN